MFSFTAVVACQQLHNLSYTDTVNVDQYCETLNNTMDLTALSFEFVAKAGPV